jgi:CheY-like chemotaxis protein
MQLLSKSEVYHAKRACLVVEDNKFDQKRISHALSQAMSNSGSQSGPRLSTYFTTTLKEAREMLETYEFHMILLNNNLPDGMGADFALELAKNPKHSKKPVVLFSDWPSPFMWDKARQAGVCFVLTKSEFHLNHVQQAMAQANRRLH